jgi:hypothetical protein
MSALAEVVAAADPALASYAVADPQGGEFERLVGEGSRAMVIEAIREGYLLHYGEARAFRGMDEDMRLLAGDSMFALGLDRLARAGDLEAIAELSDLITLSARAEVERATEVVPALWRASAERLSAASAPGARAAAAPWLENAAETGSS